MQKILTTCTLDCWDACSIEASVENDRIVKLAGNPEHPITKGFLCGKTLRFAERVEDPDRVLHPMKRHGTGWERISWEQALNEIAAEMRCLQRGPGTQAIFHLQSAGSMGLLKKLSALFFDRLGGVSEASGDICLGAGETAMTQMLGEPVSHAFEDLPHAKLVILWGRNPYGANIHLVPFLKEAKRRGAQVVLIDPVSIGGGDVIDWHIRPRPGSDFLLAIAALKKVGAARALETQSLLPATLRRQVEAFDLSDAPRKTGLTREEIDRFATLYATNRPASIWMGSGVQHHENGVETVQLFLALAAAAGNLGVPGGGVSFFQKHRKHFRSDFLRTNPAARWREIPTGQFPQLLPQLQPAIEMIWINAANPIVAMPGSVAVRECLLATKTRVVVDTHLTDTALCATHFLPSTTFLEEDGIVSSWGQNYIGRQRRALSPRGEARTDLAIFQALAARLGFGEALAGNETVWEKRFLEKGAGHARGGFGLEGKDFVSNPHLGPVPCTEGRFATSDGKLQFPADLDLSRIPFPEPNGEFPFHLITPKAKEHHLSQVVRPRERTHHILRVNPASTPRPPKAGSIVRVISKSGEIEARLEYDTMLPNNVAVLPHSGTLAKGNCANQLTGGVPLTKEPSCPAYYSCFVQISAK